MNKISFFLGPLKSLHCKKEEDPHMTSHNLEVQQIGSLRTALQLVILRGRLQVVGGRQGWCGTGLSPL